MGLFSSSKNKHQNKNYGSKHYKKKGLLDKISNIFGSSKSGSKRKNYNPLKSFSSGSSKKHHYRKKHSSWS